MLLLRVIYSKPKGTTPYRGKQDEDREYIYCLPLNCSTARNQIARINYALLICSS
jgi:hypothetical protein